MILNENRVLSKGEFTVTNKIKDLLVGDIIIFNTLENVSTQSERKLLDVGVPYVVEDIGTVCAYITSKGKRITLFSTDMNKIEVIPITERCVKEHINHKVGDEIIITDINKIEGGTAQGFKNQTIYEITKVFDNDGFIITNGDNELFISNEKGEYDYIYNANAANQKNATMLIGELEELNIENEINMCLDIRDFERLEELMKLIK